MGQKTHTNPAPMDLLVSAHTPKQANQYIILTSAIGEKLFEENSWLKGQVPLEMAAILAG